MDEVKLLECPYCHRVPTLGYCCGEYYIIGNDDCEACGRFPSMRSSSCSVEQDWNNFVADVYSFG